MKQQLIRFDWALKRLLRNKANFDILEGFLTELLKEEIKINQILESETNKSDLQDKFNRVDILVENSKKELLIIEIQNDTEFDYLQRLVYGTSKVIIENMYKGMSYSGIKKVISISIVYFDLGQGNDYVYLGQTNFVGLHHKDILQLSEAQTKLYGEKRVYQLFPEYYIIKVNQFDEIAKDSLDEWIYFLKKEEIKPEFKARGIQKAKQEFDIMKLSEDERKLYQKYLEELNYQASMYESTYKLGRIEATIEAIKKLLLSGVLSIEQIAITFDVSNEYVLKIKNQLENKT
ncbi:MAG: Rpn family recombination-promoting nuclease/putative transposase [Thermoflexibacter sp.]|jgi:predicted transposase/invertase (TIGR01784 family)|nr:Rpn family recombination-promoting nuclease/putative transposase [Thermoflexibacter sp.]